MKRRRERLLAAALACILAFTTMYCGMAFAETEGETVSQDTAVQETPVPQPVHQDGFDMENGHKVYYAGGNKVTGFRTISGSTYYFAKDTGYMLKGFQKIDGSQYYFGSESGKMYTGLHKIGKNVYTFDKKGRLVRTVYGDKKAICLTWDDGPSPYTKTIMKALKDNGAKGTFFVVGNRVNSYKKILKQNYDQGNQIGNHSWSHPDLSRMKKSKIRKQVNNTNKKIKAVTGETPRIMRTPYGVATKKVKSTVGMPIVLWSIDTLDWKTRNANKTYKAVIKNARDGDIVLMHDLYKQTANASKKIIPELKKKGFQMVTVEEMALLKGVSLKNGGVYGRMK
jgi:peptidoglycan/xylan/chitin deacetylase (PgdA/CDA1 family)